MKTNKLVILSLFILFMYNLVVLGYNRTNACSYANTYWGKLIAGGNGYNIINEPDNTVYNQNDYYEDYSPSDCANFVSQCLIAGDLNLNAGPGVDGKRYLNGTEFPSTIISADDLANHLATRADFGHKTITLPDETEIPNQMRNGDVIIYGNNAHAVIISADSGNNCKVNAHTNDRYQRPWNYMYGDGVDQKIKCSFYHYDDEPISMILKDSNGNIIADDGATLSSEILVYTDDGEIGTGIDRVEVRKNDPETGEIIFADEADHLYGEYIENDTKYNFRYQFNIFLGMYYVRIFDKAGNITTRTIVSDFTVPDLLLTDQEGNQIFEGDTIYEANPILKVWDYGSGVNTAVVAINDWPAKTYYYSDTKAVSQQLLTLGPNLNYTLIVNDFVGNTSTISFVTGNWNNHLLS